MSLTDPSVLEGLAEAQAAFRPDIPAEILAALLPPLPLRGGRLAVDVGAGPGRSTRALRLLLGPDWPVVAVEPVQDMRRALLRDLADDPDLQVLDCPPESLSLPAGIAGLVLMGDRFRHVDARRALAEAGRVLAPGGVAGIVSHDPAPEGAAAALLARLGDLGLAADGADLPDAAQMEGFAEVRQAEARWTVALDARGLVDLCLCDPQVWRVVRRAGLRRVLPDLLSACADAGLGPVPQPVVLRSRAVTGRKPG